MDKSIQATTKTSNETIAQQKVLATIGKLSGNDIQEVATVNHDKVVQLENATDITRQFLAPKVQFGPALSDAKISIYKGCLKGIRNYANQFAVFAGTNGVVFDAILAESPTEVMQNQEVQHRWKRLSYLPLGICVLDATRPAKEYLEHLQSLESTSPELVLVTFRSDSTTPQCYEVANASANASSSASSIELVQVCLQSLNENKKKGHNYLVVPVEKVGTTLEDEATCLVHAALRKHVSSVLDDTQKTNHHMNVPDLNAPRVFVAPKPVPADGLCFFHAVIGSMHLDSYSSIPRQASGYAINQRQRSLEETSAKTLLQSVLDKSDPTSAEECALATHLKINRQVELARMSWVARTLQLGIRCAIDHEACMGHNNILTA